MIDVLTAMPALTDADREDVDRVMASCAHLSVAQRLATLDDMLRLIRACMTPEGRRFFEESRLEGRVFDRPERD